MAIWSRPVKPKIATCTGASAAAAGTLASSSQMNQSCSSPKFAAPALSAVLLKTWPGINRMTGAVVLSACVIAAAAQSDSPACAKFKSEMMPKVGQKITVVGTLSDGKKGFWLAFNHWGAYIYAVKESGVAKQN